VTCNSQGQLLRWDAASIVYNLDQAAAGSFNPNSEIACPSIESVFDQFFDNRRRSLDHLSSGDL
jgi:hypothetical protein